MTGAPRWLVRLALLAYPAAFRRRFGGELAEGLHQAWDAAATASPIGRLALLVRTVVHGLAERGAALVRLMTWPSHRPHLYAPAGPRAGLWEGWLRDLRTAARGLLAARGFTVLAVAALALGIGANSAIFAVVNGVLLKPLPYRDADRLVMVWNTNPQAGGAAAPLTPADFADLRAMNQSMAAMDYALAFVIRSALAGRGDQGLLHVSRVGSRLLEVLGAPIALGRRFGDGERDVAVISDRAWRVWFGADPAIVGRRLLLAGNETVEVVGVAAPGFTFPYRSMLVASGGATPPSVDLWVPMPLDGPRWRDSNGQLLRSVHALIAVGRLAPGATLDRADDEMAGHAATLAARHPDTNRGWGADVVDLHEQTVGDVRPALLILLGGVGVLLLMAVVNVANLMLARSLARQRELAVRAALGASRGQQVRQVLAEALWLAVAGAAVSLVAVRWIVGALVALAPPSLPRIADVAPDAGVVAAAAVLAVVTAGLVGLVPMWAASRPDLQTVLRDDGRGATGASTMGRRLRAGLVIGQVALAAVLAVQGGLLTRSLAAVLDLDPGFRSDHVLTLQVSVPDRLANADERQVFHREFFAGLRSLPGVVAAGGTTRMPLASTNDTTPVRAEGQLADAAALHVIGFRRTLHDYFAVMRIPVRHGRVYDDGDAPSARQAAVVNETAARQLFGTANPVGRRLALGSDPANPWLTVVAVVGDVRHGSLETAPPPELYTSYLAGPPFAPYVVVRTAGDPAAMATSIREFARRFDSGLTLSDVRTMDSVRLASVAERRFTLTLVAAFGIVALVLAAMGVYGVITLVVTERTAELGMRLALGAMPSQVARLVIGDAVRVTAIGGAAGLAIAAGVARLIASQLYGVGPLDPVTFVGVPVALVGAAAVAALAPAVRAMRLDPVRALRAG
jgi:putative ABC transport system permease protein